MPKPQMPNVPGTGAMTDTLDFVKNLWGSMGVPGMNIPGMAVPTVSIDELDKKIADLKAVESWLNLNQSMLHGTIQALEVQRGTLATLKSMGASLAAAMKQPGAGESPAGAAPFASPFFPQGAAPQAAAPAQQPGAGTPDAATGTAPPAANPALWWNLLQEQFTKAVAGAMSPDAVAGATAMAQDAAARMGAAAGGAQADMGKAKSAATAKGAGAETDPAKPAPGKPRTARQKNDKS